ncbi:MAG: T9SS type A sorting domain-containing protein, partial [Bacteroidetes bacterium]|nr:T9SS type A sorting domain-containing protein [Bacteroidota bacterium]
VYIRIIDLVGNEISTNIFTGKQYTLDKGGMSNGIYFLQIHGNNNGMVNLKIVVE